MKKPFSALCALGVMLALTVPAFADTVVEMVDIPDEPEAPVMVVLSAPADEQIGPPPGATTYICEPVHLGAPIMYVTDEEVPIPLTARGQTHIEPTEYTSDEDYNEEFTCDPDDGNCLNIWVRNNGDEPVYVNISWEGDGISEDYKAVELGPGEQRTKVFSYDSGKGIDGTWSINVTPKYGGEISIEVSARQYQQN